MQNHYTLKVNLFCQEDSLLYNIVNYGGKKDRIVKKGVQNSQKTIEVTKNQQSCNERKYILKKVKIDHGPTMSHKF